MNPKTKTIWLVIESFNNEPHVLSNHPTRKFAIDDLADTMANMDFDKDDISQAKKDGYFYDYDTMGHKIYTIMVEEFEFICWD